MRFYTHSDQFYCGIDLHTQAMYVCILDQQGQVRLHRNMPAEPEPFLAAIEPFREDIVVGVECIFTWYWLADLCAEQDIPFILGHALYMKSIHGGKAKNDRIDSRKIAAIMRGGTPGSTIPKLFTAYSPSRASDRSLPWSFSTRSATSTASTGFRTSLRMPDWSSAPGSQPANDTEQVAPRSATPI